LKRAPIPYYGGIAIVTAFVLSILIWVKLDWEIIGFLFFGLVVAGVSFIDDRRGLSPILRLGVQVTAGIGLFFSGAEIHSLPNPFGGEINLSAMMLNLPMWGWGLAIFSLLATVLWVVMIMNTMNWIDGMNGLPSGITVIAALTIFGLSIRPDLQSIDQSTVAAMALILAMVVLAFWFHDFYPAKILMGDTGSMFLGYCLAALAIFSGGKIATAFLVMGVPILDAFWVILRRLLSGKSPLKGDLSHFHHRMINAGLSEKKALALIYAVAGVFGLMAVFLSSSQKIWAIIGLFATMAILGFGIVVLEVEKNRKKD
jgi:UDP-GlcNAc:undecaprenyl-phosphate GlcNAc-1-phosphate transferase